MTNYFKKPLVILLRQFDLGSALAVRLTQLTGKSKFPIHPKHLLNPSPWFISYIDKDDSILDLGCGNGQNSIKAAKIAQKVVGLDYDGNQLEIANKSAQSLRLKNLTFKKANLEESLELPNHSFDKVLLLDVLEHLYHRNEILREIRRVTKPGGVIFIGVPNSQTSWKKFIRSTGLNSFSDPDHKVEFSKTEIEKLLKAHKYKVLSFGYGKFDTPFRGIFDVVGSLSLSIYKKMDNWRFSKAQSKPQETSGFEIVCQV